MKQQHINFNDNWFFKRVDAPPFDTLMLKESVLSNGEAIKELQIKLDKYLKQCTDIGKGVARPWQQVTVPHTARLEVLDMAESGDKENAKRQWQGTCYYLKTFEVPQTYQNKKVFINFEGAMNVAKVWINGRLLHTHFGGYLPFTVDISTEMIVGQANTVLVELNNEDNAITGPKPMSVLDYNLYHGLYRNVTLTVKEALYITNAVHANKIADGGVFVSCDNVTQESASVVVKAHVCNERMNTQIATAKLILKDQEGEVVDTHSLEFEVKASKDKTIEHIFNVDNPNLWDTNNPYLYYAEVSIIQKDKLIDKEETRFGIRDIIINKDGCWINGKKRYLRGANRHQEYPVIGYAMSDEAQYRDAKRIKEAGLDYIRLSHYPHANAFMDACDELGLLVMNCIAGWQYFGDEAFEKLQYQNARDMIRRDRNHPCVLLWEVSLNETQMPERFIHNMHKLAHEEISIGSCYTCGWQRGYDVLGEARQHGGCHAVNDVPCVITEYGDWEYYAKNDGFTQDQWKDLEPIERSSRQFRGDGEKRLLQQAMNYQEAHNDNRSTTAFADSIWIMYDYQRGVADHIEASGIMDINRLPKFAYYFFQSQRDIDLTNKDPFAKQMVCIANYWTRESTLDVRIFSNCDEVELLVNGKSMGRQKPDANVFSNNLNHPPVTFKLTEFEAGTLIAKGYVNGKAVVETTRQTPEEPCKVGLKLEDNKCFRKNDRQLVYAYIQDESGTTVPNTQSMVQFKVTGGAKLIGSSEVHAEAGIATCLVERIDIDKEVEITATLERLEVGKLICK